MVEACSASAHISELRSEQDQHHTVAKQLTVIMLRSISFPPQAKMILARKERFRLEVTVCAGERWRHKDSGKVLC